MTTLKSDSFKSLCNLLEVLGQFCTDMLIKEGLIRQFSDDRVLIIESAMNLNESVTFNMSDIKRKLKMLKLFQDSDVSLDITENLVSFADGVTKLTFAHPVDDVLINSFISDNEFEQMVQIQNMNLLVDTTLNETVIKRSNTLADAFNVRKIFLTPDDNNQLKLRIESQDRNQTADVVTIISNQPVSQTLILPRDVFMAFSNDVSFTLFSDQDRYIAKVSGQIDDGVTMTLYTRVGVEL